MMFNNTDSKADITDHDESPMSSPIDESYKIRIGPRGSLSPRSHEDDDQSKHDDSEAQDLSISAQNQNVVPNMSHHMSQDFCKMEEESAEEMNMVVPSPSVPRSENGQGGHHFGEMMTRSDGVEDDVQ